MKNLKGDSFKKLRKSKRDSLKKKWKEVKE